MSWEVTAMKSTTSSNDMRTVLRDNFRKYWSIPLLGVVLFLFCGVSPILFSEDGVQISREMARLASNASFGYVSAILILSIGSGMTVFAYLRNPSAADYMHSLPLRRSRLFVLNVISGLLMMGVPILINAVVMTVYVGSLLFVKWAIATGVCSLCIFGITVFAGMLSGNTLMHLFNALFFNSFVTVFLATIDTTLHSLLTGYASGSNFVTLVMASNPLTAFIVSDVSRGILCSIYLPVGVVALVLAGFLYRKRRIERTGESVMFPWVRTVLFLYCIFCGSGIIGIVMTELFVTGGSHRLSVVLSLGMIVGALLIFIVGSLLIDRTARIFTRRNLLPACIALLLAFAVSFGLSADIFGYSRYIPETEEIESVYLNPYEVFLADSTEDMMIYSLTPRIDAKFYDLPKKDAAEAEDAADMADNADAAGTADTADAANRADAVDMVDAAEILEDVRVFGLKDPEAIEAVRQLHEALGAQPKEESYSVSGSVSLMYKLKNGHKVCREYIIYSDSDGNTAPGLKSAVSKSVQKYYDSKGFRDAYSLNNLKASLFDKGTILYYPEASYDEVTGESAEPITIPHKYSAGLKAALEADFQECSYEDSKSFSSYVSVSIPESESEYEEIPFPIPDKGKHMKAWVKEHKSLLLP